MVLVWLVVFRVPAVFYCTRVYMSKFLGYGVLKVKKFLRDQGKAKPSGVLACFYSVADFPFFCSTSVPGACIRTWR